VRSAVGQGRLPLDGGDDLAEGDGFGRAGQGVTAVGATLGLDQTGATQILEHLGQQPLGHWVGLADLTSAHGLTHPVRQVDQGDEAVFGAFCELQHG